MSTNTQKHFQKQQQLTPSPSYNNERCQNHSLAYSHKSI